MCAGVSRRSAWLGGAAPLGSLSPPATLVHRGAEVRNMNAKSRVEFYRQRATHCERIAETMADSLYSIFSRRQSNGARWPSKLKNCPKGAPAARDPHLRTTS